MKTLSIICISLFALIGGALFLKNNHYDYIRWYETNIVLNSSYLQKRGIENTRDAIQTLLENRTLKNHKSYRYQTIHIVGGSVFPRTVIAMRELYPNAKIIVTEQFQHHIDLAKEYLRAHHYPTGNITFIHGKFTADHSLPCDLIILPLDYEGEMPTNAPVIVQHLFLTDTPSDDSTLFSYLNMSNMHLYEPR